MGHPKRRTTDPMSCVSSTEGRGGLVEEIPSTEEGLTEFSLSTFEGSTFDIKRNIELESSP